MKKVRAFTLIELLVVISIIGLLSSVVLASLNSARSKARLSAAQQFSGQVARAISASAAGIWNFEGVSGSTVEDRSGNDNTGSIVGTPSYVTGPVGPSTAIGLFNDTYVQVPDSASLDMGTSDFTVMAWIRTTGYFGHGSAWNMIVGKGDCCANPGFALGYDNTNIPRFMVNANGTASTGTPINDNEWHHVAGVRKGTTIVSYIDGKETGTITVAPIGTSVDNSSPFYIGKDANGVIRAIRGYVDDVIFAPSALTASEVYGVYAKGPPDARIVAR